MIPRAPASMDTGISSAVGGVNLATLLLRFASFGPCCPPRFGDPKGSILRISSAMGFNLAGRAFGTEARRSGNRTWTAGSRRSQWSGWNRIEHGARLPPGRGWPRPRRRSEWEFPPPKRLRFQRPREPSPPHLWQRIGALRQRPVEKPGIEVPETGSAPSRPIPTDPIRERSVAPRRVVAGKAPWRLGAIMRPLIGRRSGGSDGKTPACHSPPPRVPRLTVWGDMERDARFLGQPVPREVVAEDPEQVTAVAGRRFGATPSDRSPTNAEHESSLRTPGGPTAGPRHLAPGSRCSAVVVPLHRSLPVPCGSRCRGTPRPPLLQRRMSGLHRVSW